MVNAKTEAEDEGINECEDKGIVIICKRIYTGESLSENFDRQGPTQVYDLDAVDLFEAN